MARLTLGCVSVEVSQSSLGPTGGTKVLEGALRMASGRRIGDVDAPLGGMLVPADRGRGGACEAVVSNDAAEFIRLDDLLSGMLDKRCKLPAPMLGFVLSMQKLRGYPNQHWSRHHDGGGLEGSWSRCSALHLPQNQLMTLSTHRTVESITTFLPWFTSYLPFADKSKKPSVLHIDTGRSANGYPDFHRSLTIGDDSVLSRGDKLATDQGTAGGRCRTTSSDNARWSE